MLECDDASIAEKGSEGDMPTEGKSEVGLCSEANEIIVLLTDSVALLESTLRLWVLVFVYFVEPIDPPSAAT